MSKAHDAHSLMSGMWIRTNILYMLLIVECAIQGLGMQGIKMFFPAIKPIISHISYHEI